MANINMTVVLDDTHLDKTDEMCASLERAGLEVEQVLPEVGVISGSGDERVLESIRAIEGVGEARPEHTFQLPPFSQKVPQ